MKKHSHTHTPKKENKLTDEDELGVSRVQKLSRLQRVEADLNAFAKIKKCITKCDVSVRE